MTENGSNLVMPVAPMYGQGGGMGGGFGGWGSDGWLILIILLALGGWGGNGFGGGFGGAGNAQLGYDFPWLMNGQQGINNNVSDGFRDAQLHDSVTSVRDGISSLSTQLCNCCGDVQMSIANGFAGVNSNLCNGFNGVNMSVNNAQNSLAQQLYTNQIADLQRSFDAQTATTTGMNNIGMSLQNCCCENRAGIADLKYTVATENCADRTAAYQNTRDIIDSQTKGTQAILDKLCSLELQGVKGQLEQAQRDNVALQNQLNMATLRESQTAQNAFISQGFANEVDQLYNRLNNCPIPSTPVYGRQNIFQCPQNQGCGCGCGGF
jgi:hypothetical protein